jgi:polar amino acid transport system ATP-binding protein
MTDTTTTAASTATPMPATALTKSAASTDSISNVNQNNQPIVALQQIQKSFGSSSVLKDISISVKKGEVLAIIGPSGSGKSTLLRCATLLESFESGSLIYDDLVVAYNDSSNKAVYASKDVQHQARMKFGLVFQNFNLFPHYSVLHNITDAPISVQKRPKAEVVEQAHQLLRQMGLEDKAAVAPCELSGGQCQRVAIARALCCNPEILFFDEPTSALDPELTQEVLKVILELARQHMTMVIVTHEMSFARDVADRIIFMDDGTIVEQGNAKELINHPQHARTKAFLNNYESKTF